MSIATDIRSYADTAIEQAQQQFADATDNANEFLGRVAGTAKENVAALTDKAQGLRTQAEKTLNVDALKSAVEPYLAQAQQYRKAVTDTLTDTLTDTVAGPVIATVSQTVTTVLGVVNERVVRPARDLTGFGAKSAPANRGASKPASTRPAVKKPAARATAATKPAGTRATTKTATTKKAAAKPTAPRKTAAKKSATTTTS